MAAADIVTALQGLGQSLEAATGSTYANAGFRIVDQVKKSIKENRVYDTGNLYRSVGFVNQGDALVLTMADYGFYQNFGVVGVDNDPGTEEVTFGLKPKRGSKYAFTEDSIERAKAKGAFGWMIDNMRFGIRARDFINVQEMEDILAEEMLISQLRAVENTFQNTYII